MEIDSVYIENFLTIGIVYLSVIQFIVLAIIDKKGE